MKSIPSFTGEQLASALQALDIQFILGGDRAKSRLHKQPADLLASLAVSPESRLRLALIPLLLTHPEFSSYAWEVSEQLSPSARITLQCYYTAAVCMQQKYHARLVKLIGAEQPLPDLFSAGLQLHFTQDPDSNLRILAARHQALSGQSVNWLGTYEHAAQTWMRHLEL